MSKEVMELANVAAESIMKLTKENEKLKEERNRDAGEYLGLLEKNTGLNLEIEELKEEIEKLKVENKEEKDIVALLFEETGYPDDIAGPGYTKSDAIYEWVHNGEDLRRHADKQNKELTEEIKELKSQIPDKKGKKLSQKDKEVMKDILWDLEYDVTHPKDHKLKLIKRLMK